MPNTSLLLRNGLYFSGAYATRVLADTRIDSIPTAPWKHGVGGPMGNPVLDSWRRIPESSPISCWLYCRACLANGTLAA